MIRKGMTEEEVIGIMGEPNTMTKKEKESETVYGYQSNNVDYLNIEVTFDSTGRVINVFIPIEKQKC